MDFLIIPYSIFSGLCHFLLLSLYLYFRISKQLLAICEVRREFDSKRKTSQEIKLLRSKWRQGSCYCKLSIVQIHAISEKFQGQKRLQKVLLALKVMIRSLKKTEQMWVRKQLPFSKASFFPFFFTNFPTTED